MPLKLSLKILASLLNILVCMLILPILLIRFCEPGTGMSVSMLLFFAVNPMNMIFIGLMAGTDIKKLFWIPILASFVFPLFFGVAIGDLVFELYIYSAIYLALGTVAMLAVHFLSKLKR